jgi:1,4-dihydroxy-2-naphthoate octaprenyltransferase
VRLGERNARCYHLVLVVLALLLFASFVIWQSSASFAWLCLLPALALMKVTKTVMLERQHQLLDKQLQLTAKLSFFIALLFSLGLQFHY